MAATRRSKKSVETSKSYSKGSQPPRSLVIAEKGINTSSNYKSFMSALMTDVVAGTVSPSVTNAACNAGGKLTRMIELEYKYGSTESGGRRKVLQLTVDVLPEALEQAQLPAHESEKVA